MSYPTVPANATSIAGYPLLTVAPAPTPAASAVLQFFDDAGVLRVIANTAQIAGGGTGATTAADARTALSAAQASAATQSGGAGSLSGASASAATGLTVAALTLGGHVRYEAVLASATDTYVATVAVANGAQILAAQPDVPRSLVIYVTDVDSSITAGTLTIVYLDQNGVSVTEAWTLANQGSHSRIPTYPVSKITSITVSGIAGNTGADTINAGPLNGLGLPCCTAISGRTVAVHKATCNNVDETVGTVNATYGTIIPTSAPNGTRVYDFFYTYTFAVPVTDAGHVHDGGTFATPAHTHVQS